MTKEAFFKILVSRQETRSHDTFNQESTRKFCNSHSNTQG